MHYLARQTGGGQPPATATPLPPTSTPTSLPTNTPTPLPPTSTSTPLPPTSTPIPPYRDQVLSDSPVAYWRLGEASGTSAADQRGLRPGSYVGGPALGVGGALTGDANTAATFAAGQYVTVPDAAALSPQAGPSGKLSLEAWVKLAALPTGGPAAVVAKGASGAYEYALRIQPTGAVEIILWASGGTTYQAIASPVGSVATGGWYHLVGTCQNGASCQVYVNGVQRAVISSGWGTTPPSDGSAPVMIGRRGDGAQTLSGTIDEVAVYNTTLSATRVQEHYRAGR
jgi:hypothetical protein